MPCAGEHLFRHFHWLPQRLPPLYRILQRCWAKGIGQGQADPASGETMEAALRNSNKQARSNLFAPRCTRVIGHRARALRRGRRRWD